MTHDVDKLLSGQKKLQAALKPAAEKAKAKAQRKAKAAPPAQPKVKAKAKAKYVMKKHKKKSASAEGGSFYVAAVCDNTTGKQLTQLSENATPMFERFVSEMVTSLNNGEITPAECIDQMNRHKMYNG